MSKELEGAAQRRRRRGGEGGVVALSRGGDAAQVRDGGVSLKGAPSGPGRRRHPAVQDWTCHPRLAGSQDRCPAEDLSAYRPLFVHGVAPARFGGRVPAGRSDLQDRGCDCKGPAGPHAGCRPAEASGVSPAEKGNCESGPEELCTEKVDP